VYVIVPLFMWLCTFCQVQYMPTVVLPAVSVSGRKAAFEVLCDRTCKMQIDLCAVCLQSALTFVIFLSR
jgi:hypothetical protein